MLLIARPTPRIGANCTHLTPSPCRCSRDEVKLLDPTGAIVSSVGWQAADMGSVLRLQPDLKTYRSVPETKNVLETLAFLGGYDTFVAALKVNIISCTSVLYCFRDPAPAASWVHLHILTVQHCSHFLLPCSSSLHYRPLAWTSSWPPRTTPPTSIPPSPDPGRP